MPLPKPVVHFDALLKSELPLLKEALGLTPEEQAKIILDPTGQSCGLGALAESYSTTYAMLRLALMYHINQEQVVVVGPKMQAAFGHTSLENIPIDLLKLPHPCFYLATPESEGLELWGGERTQWHKVAGCYVAMDPASDSNSLSILAWGVANERSFEALDDATFWFRLDLDRWVDLEEEFSQVSSDENLQKTLANTEYESAMHQAAEELLKEGKISYPDAATALAKTAAHRSANLDKALMNLLGNRGAEASDLGADAKAHHIERMRETARKLMRIVVNTILYMNSTSADMSAQVSYDNDRAKLRSELKRLKNPRKGKGRSLQRRLDALPYHKVVWVGPTIEQSKDDATNFTDATGRRVSAHIRRGHWHTFLSGPRKVEGVLVPSAQRVSTLKWVPPLWIGSTAKAGPPGRVYGIREPQGVTH